MIESNLPQTWSEKKTSQLTGGGGGGGCKRSMTTDTELGLSNDQFTIVNSDSVPSVCSYYAITDQVWNRKKLMVSSFEVANEKKLGKKQKNKRKTINLHSISLS